MAKVDLNPIFDTVRGKVGDLVLKRYGDGVVMARAGESSQPKSAAQLAHQERFRAATEYGKGALMNPARRALYAAAARQRGLPVFATMVADFFNSPSILMVDATEYTGQAGSRVTVLADDDFAVARVQVVIATAPASGTPQIVEQGAAVETPVDSGRYYYTATQAAPANTPLRITVSVTDLPGNGTSQAVDKAPTQAPS